LGAFFLHFLEPISRKGRIFFRAFKGSICRQAHVLLLVANQ